MPRSFSTLWPSDVSPPSPSCAEKVLTTYELLENILIHLPMHNIFTCQRVSRQWQSIIQRSVRLREAMFLTSSSTPLRPEDTVYNRTVLCCWNRGQTLYRAEEALTFNPAASVGVAFCIPRQSLLKKPFGAFRFHLHHYPRLTIEALPEIAQGERASWKDMFLTEPPVIAIDFMFRGGMSPFGHLFALWNPHGIKFGDLIDWRWKIANEIEESGREAVGEIECSFHVTWPGFDPREEVW
ncbi:uncharacterized protein RCC_00176 [Ramularia collo-cygni]|uniref:F-box domain-containing protein n=1 Tax=Ramularia collo-cygni TaxID=112498 RepID=A0A2D3UL97_9PEZI|nr:uncharacterized protein RCC_00176 [Ramularia collo-cygni]CZT14202.1 uncharacterized protein RCC_00176 [Ramularia collo-cygni]